MPLFLDTADSEAHVLKAIKGAGAELVLISPFVQLSPRVEQWLGTIDKGGRTEIRLVCRVDSLAEAEEAKLRAFENIAVRHMDDLHAKCYANEDGIVLTSLNLYAASSKNYEMGVYFDADEDAELYEKAMAEARHIWDHAEPADIGGSKRKGRAWLFRASKSGKKSGSPVGHCIRCGTSTDYDPKKPYCGRCFRQWLRFKNPTYADDRCHGCGKEESKGFSLEKPECYSCYKRHARGGVTA